MLKQNMLIERTSRKNIVALLAVILIVFGCMFYIKSQELSNQILEKKGDYYTVKAALTKFPAMEVLEGKDTQEIVRNLIDQKRTVALQIAGLTTEKYDLYYEASTTLALMRQEAYELEGYEKIADLLPSPIENEMQLTYFQFMSDAGISKVSNLLEYMPFLLFFFSMIGAGWYLFVSVYTSTLMLDDFDHLSLIKGLPVKFEQYVFAKCMVAFGFIVMFILLIFVSALPLLFMNGFSSVEEHKAVYLGEVELLSSIQYIAVVIFYMLIVALFTMVLSIILNVLLKNMYLTLFVHAILFFLPVIVPNFISLIPYNPYNFMHFNDLLSGVPLSLANPVDIHLVHGLVVLLLSIGLMLVVIKLFLSTGKMKRA